MQFSFSAVDVVILSDLRGTPLWSAVTCYRFGIADLDRESNRQYA